MLHTVIERGHFVQIPWRGQLAQKTDHIGTTFRRKTAPGAVFLILNYFFDAQRAITMRSIRDFSRSNIHGIRLLFCG